MHITELTTEQEVLDLIRYHNEHSEYIVLDLETTGLSPFTDRITDIVLSGYQHDSAVIFSGAYVHTLKEIQKPHVCHHRKFDAHFLLRAGVDLRDSPLLADTLLLDHLLDENVEHSLDAIVKRRYNDPYKELFWSKYKTYEEAPRQEQINYASADVCYTARVYRDTISDLTQAGIPQTLIDHVHAFALSLYNTEVEGIKLDLPYLETMGADLSGKISSLKREMRDSVDLECSILENNAHLKAIDERKTDKGKANVKRPEFNFDSNTQLGHLLHNQLRLPIQFNRKRKQTLDDDALAKLEPMHPLIPKLREYKGHQKVFTSFIEGSLEKSVQGRIYPTFNVNGTVTGRISSSNPNLQQLPTDGGVRGIYIPDPGYRFITCDYNSLEVTLAAHFSRDKNLLKIVYEGASLHDITAEGLGIPRHLAKTINFGLQYGAGAHKVAQVLGVSLQEGEKALSKYWETYAGLKAFMDTCHRRIDQGLPLINPFGRRRRFPTVFDNHWDRERAYRQGANSIIQSTGADCTNISMYRVDQRLRSMGVGKALLPIHDEVLVSCKENACEETANTLVSIMEGIAKEINLSVPLKASVSKPMLRWEK